MASSAAKARTPRSAPGSKRAAIRAGGRHEPRCGPSSGRSSSKGFTLIELLVVVALIAIASGLISLSLRDPASTQLENEAARLAALLESARAESRASGIAVRWEPHNGSDASRSEGFQFKGLTNPADYPQHWLGPGVSVEIVGAQMVVLGPEPLIPPQRIVLKLEDQRLALATDGLGPFTVAGNEAAGAAP